MSLILSSQMCSDLSKIQHLKGIWHESETKISGSMNIRDFWKNKIPPSFQYNFPFFLSLCEFLIFLICIAITLCHFPLFLVHKFFTCLPYDLTHCSRFVHSFQIGVFREKHFGSKMQLGQTKKHTGSKLSSNVYKSEAFFCWPSMPMGIEVRDCFFKIGCIILRNFNESINQGYPNGFIHLSLPKIREKT